MNRVRLNPLRFVLEAFRFSLTDPGKALVVGFLLSVLTGTLTLTIPVYHLFTAMGVTGAAILIAAVMSRPRLAREGSLPDRVVAGQPFTVVYRLTNRDGRRTAYDVSIGFFGLPPTIRQLAPAETICELAPGESVEIAVRLQADRRGLYSVPAARHFSTFPFNLFRSGPLQRRRESLLVLPSFHRLGGVDLDVGKRYQPGGIALTSHIGESPEYIGNRDYRPGDSLRRIEPRAWARLATPIVREYSEEYYCRIALVLDTYMPAALRKRPVSRQELEAAISLTAAVADAVGRGEFVIDLFAAGPELYVFRAGRHTAHFENVLEILACLDPCRNNPFDVVAPALSDELQNISTAVFLFLDWDASRERLVRMAIEAGCSARVILIRNGRCHSDPAEAEPWTGPIRTLGDEEIRDGRIDRL